MAGYLQSMGEDPRSLSMLAVWRKSCKSQRSLLPKPASRIVVEATKFVISIKAIDGHQTWPANTKQLMAYDMTRADLCKPDNCGGPV